MESKLAGVVELAPFLDRGQIAEVIRVIKSGKEATTWICRASGKLGNGLIAAKVYKELTQRSFRNDSAYQSGKVIPSGRVRRAFEQKSSFGKEVQMGMWVHEEYETLSILHDEGLDVPKPLAHAGRAILMEYLGSENEPAPQLSKARIDRSQARKHFERILWNIEEMLACCCVHGDLSPYNMLFWRERVVLIDFPQAIDPRFNTNARNILARDIENVCRAFDKFGLRMDSERITRRFWHKFVQGDYD